MQAEANQKAASDRFCPLFRRQRRAPDESFGFGRAGYGWTPWTGS